ncbi:methyltransferase [Penicillium crustosum]|uniref:methyltransferase n=1 Tax=Penicillium crustosum TaxID=36656 RepID=UPI0023A157E6|nr:methyltransferase [Penicillium crustosum]KAJ5395325.1 methyltransferase [Penicillium crustosum]
MGAPDNEVVNLINKVCTPLSEGYRQTDHQGFLLQRTTEVFKAAVFADITLHHVEAYYNFLEKGLLKRSAKAAEVLRNFWYENDPNLLEMKRQLLPVLEKHFTIRPDSVSDKAVILIAMPLPN